MSLFAGGGAGVVAACGSKLPYGETAFSGKADRQFPDPLLRFTEGRPVTVDVHNDTGIPELQA
ncbi:hypothetical protein [Streptomyces sp. NPDC096152]|uniref:hypothetical protein n=1 Tax=Streptomyces sp. NPDC096152 TaxID=3366078 RepID=UPI00381D3739